LRQNEEESRGEVPSPGAHADPAPANVTARRPSRGISAELEWVGGTVELPGSLGVHGVPLRRLFAVWLELPTRVVLAHEPSDPEHAPGLLPRLLRVALADPTFGRPRVPARIRVGTAQLARTVRRWVPAKTVIVVAPTPEIEQAARALAAHFQGESCAASQSGGLTRARREGAPSPSPPKRRPAPGASQSYFLDGQVDNAITERLFAGSQALYIREPWKRPADVIRVDIGQLGVYGACLSIAGPGASVPLISLCLDWAHAEDLARSASCTPRYRRITPRMPILTLRFEYRTAIPVRARREINVHGWPIVSPRSYPWIESYDRDGIPKAVTAIEFAAVTAATHALACLCWKQPELLNAKRHGPISVTIAPQPGPSVRLTVPYESFDTFAPIPGPGRPLAD